MQEPPQAPFIFPEAIFSAGSKEIGSASSSFEPIPGGGGGVFFFLGNRKTCREFFFFTAREQDEVQQIGMHDVRFSFWCLREKESFSANVVVVVRQREQKWDLFLVSQKHSYSTAWQICLLRRNSNFLPHPLPLPLTRARRKVEKKILLLYVQGGRRDMFLKDILPLFSSCFALLIPLVSDKNSAARKRTGLWSSGSSSGEKGVRGQHGMVMRYDMRWNRVPLP